MKIDIKVPLLMVEDDYHGIEALDNTLRYLNYNLKVKELGCNGVNYFGIVYYDNEPDEDEINKLLDS